MVSRLRGFQTLHGSGKTVYTTPPVNNQIKDVAKLNQSWWLNQTPYRILRHNQKSSKHLFYIESNSVTHDKKTSLCSFCGQRFGIGGIGVGPRI